MPRKPGRRKQIGRVKRRTKKANQQKDQPTPSQTTFDHSYATQHGTKEAEDLSIASPTSDLPDVYIKPAKSCPQCTLQSPEFSSIRPPCNFRGNFDYCSCIVHHEDVNPNKPTENFAASNDFDGISATEYSMLYGTSTPQYEPDEDPNICKHQNLRKDILDNEGDVNALGMDFVKNAQKLHFVQFYEHDVLNIKLAVTINFDLTPAIAVHGKIIPRNHPAYNNMTEISIFSDLLILLKTLCKYFVCAGNAETELVSCFTGKGNGYLDEYQGSRDGPTIRSNSCAKLTLGLRCSDCMRYRVSLRNMKKRAKEHRSPISVSSSRPNSSMTLEELSNKSNLQSKKIKLLEAQNQRLRETIRKSIEEQEEMNESSAAEIDTLVNNCKPEVESAFPEGSFQRIFWDEQVKYNNCKSKSAMRWHPLIVKWALFMKSKSSKAYQAMKDSGFINLPSERTLYDYSHCVESKMGFVPGAVRMLIKECTAKEMLDDDKPWKAYVNLLQDEMKVKEDLVYCATTGQLVGYIHLDDISNEILNFENGLNNKTRDLATSCLVVLVRGLTTNLKFPLAAFSTKGLDAKQLNKIMWRTIELLEIDVGLKVLCVTCDGAGQNRAFFELNKPKNHPAGEPVNSCPNRYADDGRLLYFISDVPHLLKTTRNCFANSGSHRKTRNLWKDGSNILWTQIVTLYKEKIENSLYAKSKLTRAHIDLTPFSQMKVNMAAQVLSEHVAKHLTSDYGEEVRETATFITHMNKWFDCLNARHLYEGKEKRNENVLPYTDPEDPRLTYLLETFLGYFDEWKSSVENRPGAFSKDERLRMQLSYQTLDGLKISVRSIVSCTRFLLNQGAPFVFTVRFNQDVLEQHFGHYRFKGGACDNPTIDSVRHTMNVLRVVGSTAVAPLRGNCKRMSDGDRDSLINTKLDRKKPRTVSDT